MAAAPLKLIVDTEAVGTLLTGAALALWPGALAAGLGLTPTPPSWAIVRITGVVLVAFGALLWSVRSHVARERSVVVALAVGHGAAGALMLAQQVAIWTNRTGFLVAAVPLALAVRYAQYAVRPTAAPAVDESARA